MASFEIKGSTLLASGSLGYSDFPEFERCYKQCLKETEGDLLVDMSDVERMSSAYMGALLELAHSLIERGRGMKLKASPAVKRLVDLTGLADTLSMI